MRVTDHVPSQNYTSKRKAQGKAVKCSSDGSLIATLYVVKWMVTFMSKGRRHEWCTNEREMCKFTMKWQGGG